MHSAARRFWNDEAGVVISAELVLILTILVLGVIVGLVQVQHAVVAELNDIGLAFSHLNQSYAFTGFSGARKWWGPTSWTAGSSFIDLYDGSLGLAAADIGWGVGAGGGYGQGFGYGYGYGFGSRTGICAEAAYGTIVLSDGTFIPITMIASGTWSLPGGLILAATSANSNRLLLADGTTIPFLFGACGTIELADGTVHAVRPGAIGTWVLADGRVLTLDRETPDTLLLPDGTKVVFRWANPLLVIQADGTTVEVKTAAAGTLVLIDGRVLKLSDAILPPGSEQNLPALPVTPVVPDCTVLPPTPLSPDCEIVPQAPLPQTQLPQAPVPQIAPVPECCSETSGFRERYRKRILTEEIPQGPAPQNLPQL